MRNEVVARPYARALFSLAQASGKEGKMAEELHQVLLIWDGDREFGQFIRRPEVAATVKKEAVHRIFSNELDPVTQHLLDVVIDKNREEELSTIFEEYRNLWDASRGIVHAEVTSADALTDEQQKALAEALGRAIGHTVKVTLKENSALMAGVVVRIGDRVLDGSLARRLAILGDRLRRGDGGGNVVEH